MAKRKSKNQLRREKAKARKQETPHLPKNLPQAPIIIPNPTDIEPIEVESVEDDELFKQFEGIFNKFAAPPASSYKDPSKTTQKTSDFEPSDSSNSESSDSETENQDRPLSKRQLRKQQKVLLVDLKTSTPYPQVVEWYDADAKDPYLLVSIKSSHNVVPVPHHWTSKKDFLSGRKGIERKIYELPLYILATGIQDMRKTEDERSLKQLQRDRVQPKMGKLDVDYQKLHDAFFKHQTKPRLYGFGDVYFEGKESTYDHADELLSIKPGKMSRALREALGLSGAPPVWIKTMKQIGKPPAYKHVIIPGIDVEYSNTKYTRPGEEEAPTGQLWGQLGEDDSEDDYEDEDEEVEQEEHDEDENDRNIIENEDQEVAEEEDGPVKVSISEFGGHKLTSKAAESSSSSGKKLYEVLEEHLNTQGLSSIVYDMPDDDKESSQKQHKGESELINGNGVSGMREKSQSDEKNTRAKFKF